MVIVSTADIAAGINNEPTKTHLKGSEKNIQN